MTRKKCRRRSSATRRRYSPSLLARVVVGARSRDLQARPPTRRARTRQNWRVIVCSERRLMSTPTADEVAGERERGRGREREPSEVADDGKRASGAVSCAKALKLPLVASARVCASDDYLRSFVFVTLAEFLSKKTVLERRRISRCLAKF